MRGVRIGGYGLLDVRLQDSGAGFFGKRVGDSLPREGRESELRDGGRDFRAGNRLTL